MSRPKLKTPAVPPPAAVPRVDIETPEQEMLKVRRRKGYESTLLAGALVPKKAKTTLLAGAV